jgi:hypothetical protein
MKQLLHIAFFLLIGLQAFAQPGPPDRERIHAIKVGFITDRLDLTSKEAEGFWPVYNRYDDEFISLRMQYRKKYMKNAKGDMNPADAHKFIDEDIEYREKMVELKKKYKDEFLKVISASKLAELYQAEADFKEMLIKRLEKGPRGRGGRPPGGRPGMRGR